MRDGSAFCVLRTVPPHQRHVVAGRRGRNRVRGPGLIAEWPPAARCVEVPVLPRELTIMLVAPVTVVICNRLGIAAQPYLIAEILAANIGGAATLIGDPPNIIIGSRAGLSFTDFLVH